MGKKSKVGKQRKDKFYHLAKETGYRSRSAFKLIQLNRKFGFLQSSRCLIDLCAAPGGWLQVASKSMPVSSIIIGIDLVPIKPIHNVITLQEDITTDRCKQLISKELHTWKADCVLNDGAPNVGAAWIHDAFTQAHLTLSALKLACNFLQEGGWFITKVFRSKDYQPLLWVFQQLFKKVHSTKPQASRSESAEIFVVCQGYIAPAKIDPKFLDPKHIFKEVEPEGKKAINILQIKKQKKTRAEGYNEGDYTLFQSAKVSDFLQTERPLDVLSAINEIVFDDKKYEEHVMTTDDIKESVKDIKVLGKSDIKSLLSWHRTLRKEFVKQENKNSSADQDSEVAKENEEEKLEKRIEGLKEEENALMKRQKKKVRQQRQKLQEKMNLKMILPEDGNNIECDGAMFSLANIKSKQHLESVDNEYNAGMEFEDEEEDNKEGLELESGSEESHDDSDSGTEGNENDEDDEELAFNDEDRDMESTNKTQRFGEKNPLLVELEPNVSLTTRANMWFEKDVFKDLENEADEDVEISKMVEEYKNQGGTILEKNSEPPLSAVGQNGIKREAEEKTKHLKKVRWNDEKRKENNSSDGESDSVSESEEETKRQPQKQTKKTKQNDIEIVPVEDNAKYLQNLTPEGLALGHKMAFSCKDKRDIIDSGYHRWAFNDESLPDWFIEDEAKHYLRQLPVSKEIVAQYRGRMKEINARPIKKIAEAKARKKHKRMKLLEKARKKAEAICDTVDVSEKEKMNQIRSLYKKAVLKGKPKEVKYVVAKKSQAAKRIKRPAGIKGPYKMVDPRMKKDLRSQKGKEKKGKKAGKKRK
ncbi:pre-rRNA 2'-O-ribose RNA methyltransferase FTSJ3-like isoform X2 [Montipora capricornis]|uniref:pre-rRNA 2'-O-ribose RNA methyltransferase FTSJ3-like isoform X2 n=1 Tax=Montipora capricornis TaxID=246305 RepID=UPI0035F10A6A